MSDSQRPAQRIRVEQGIYQQPNGKYAVCFMAEGKPRFRTVGYDLGTARIERAAYIDATRLGIVPAAPRLRFARVAGWWVERYERRVEAGERRERTLEHHRYHLNKHLLPILGRGLMRAITVGDVAELMTELRAKGRSEKTVAGALATLQRAWCASRSATAGSSRTRLTSSRPASARAGPPPPAGAWSRGDRSPACGLSAALPTADRHRPLYRPADL